MSKMTVIQLLNKIANGEEVPSPIYHNNLYYDFEDGDYFNQKTIKWLFNDSDIETILNDEVEVIEEDKKMKTIEQLECYHQYDECWVKDKFHQDQKGSLVDEIIIDKINEIIDKLNEMENE